MIPVIDQVIREYEELISSVEVEKSDALKQSSHPDIILLIDKRLQNLRMDLDEKKKLKINQKLGKYISKHFLHIIDDTILFNQFVFLVPIKTQKTEAPWWKSIYILITHIQILTFISNLIFFNFCIIYFSFIIFVRQNKIRLNYITI